MFTNEEEQTSLGRPLLLQRSALKKSQQIDGHNFNASNPRKRPREDDDPVEDVILLQVSRSRCFANHD